MKPDDTYDVAILGAGLAGLTLARQLLLNSDKRILLLDERARWVVDTTGRGRFLARKLGLGRENPIRHGASVLWVDGILDIDKLTDRSPAEVRRKRDRSAIGHLPFWLATNHFMGEGFW